LPRFRPLIRGEPGSRVHPEPGAPGRLPRICVGPQPSGWRL